MYFYSKCGCLRRCPSHVSQFAADWYRLSSSLNLLESLSRNLRSDLALNPQMAFGWCKNEIHHRMSFQLAFHRFQTTKPSENPSINLQKGGHGCRKVNAKAFKCLVIIL